MPPFSIGCGVIILKSCVKLLCVFGQYVVGLREDDSDTASGGTDGCPRCVRRIGSISVESYSLCSYAEAQKTAGCSCHFCAKSARLLVGVTVML